MRKRTWNEVKVKKCVSDSDCSCDFSTSLDSALRPSLFSPSSSPAAEVKDLLSCKRYGRHREPSFNGIAFNMFYDRDITDIKQDLRGETVGVLELGLR